MSSSAFKCARPMLSLDYCEARQRARGLYRAWYRHIPYIVKHFDIPKTEAQVRDKLRSKFYANAAVCDVRIVDLLVLKGYMELQEVRDNFMQKGRVMAHWNTTAECVPKDFLGKFLEGID